jgi:hypothetical protein
LSKILADQSLKQVRFEEGIGKKSPEQVKSQNENCQWRNLRIGLKGLIVSLFYFIRIFADI